jgi:hypothetical protein
MAHLFGPGRLAFASTAVLLLAGCGAATGGATTPAASPGGTATTGPTGTPAAPHASNAAWDTYHADNLRSGTDPSGASYRSLSPAWTSPQLDGKVYAEPLVWSGLVIVATENDTLYGLRAGDGSVAWSTHVGTPVPQSALPCGDIDPEGITSTPAIEPSSGRVFAVGEMMVNGAVGHQLVALDAATGKLAFRESADPAGMTSPSTHQERGAVAVAGGRVYVPYGGLDGDCGNYHGWVVAAPTSGPGQLIAYQVPTAREGAIWAPPGPSVDSAGNVWVATGNGSSSTTYDYGDSVIKLSPTLSVLDSFAPSNWAADNANDADLGSTSPMLLAGNLVFQVGKESTGYLLSASHLGGIGGQLFSANVCFTIGGEAAAATDVYVACSSGIKDVHVTASPPSFRVAWSGPSGATGPPIIAGGLVWSVGGSSQTLYGLDPASGSAVVQQHLAGTPAAFSTPAAGDGLLVVGTGRAVQAFSGPITTTSARYWLPAADGGVFNYGSAGFYGSAGPSHPTHPVVGMAATPDGNGYWLVASDGGVFNFGDAGFHGSTGALRLNRPIVGMAATPDGGGYWLVASDGGIFSFGDAGFHGSTGALRLNRPIVGMAATGDGKGYWLAASDGGIFSFGDAGFHGSTGSLRLNRPIVGVAATGDGKGYWLAASDGGVFTFGDAPFRGSAGSLRLTRPVVGLGADIVTGGYWLAASDGGVFAYGAPFGGSAGGTTLAAPIVGITAKG